MKLLLVGRAGSRAVDWSGYALLRDNVQHFIEGGEPTERFAALHGIEKAVDCGSSQVDAARLRGEVLRAWYALWSVSLDRAAVSLRTRAVLTGCTEGPTARGTVRALQVGWELPVVVGGRAGRVSESAKHFVAAVMLLTENVVDGDRLDVRRHGTPPRFARSRAGDGYGVVSTPRVRWSRLPLKAMIVAAFAVGCSAGWTPPPKTPPDVEAEQEATTNVERRNVEDRQEPILAPPPAYGNKVVRAQAQNQTRSAGSSN